MIVNTVRSFNEGWGQFEIEIIPNIQDQLAKYKVHLRKAFCQYYSSGVNQQLRRYFRANNWMEMVEPRDVKAEF